MEILVLSYYQLIFFAIGGVLYAESAIKVFISNFFSLLNIPMKLLLSCSLPGCIEYPNIQPFLSHAVWAVYANTCLWSPLWNRPLSGSVLLC